MEFHVEVQVDYLSRLDQKRWGDHIMRCPKCNEPVWTWLVAGVRYEYVGQLEGTARFLSELQQGSDSDDESDPMDKLPPICRTSDEHIFSLL